MSRGYANEHAHLWYSMYSNTWQLLEKRAFIDFHHAKPRIMQQMG